MTFPTPGARRRVVLLGATGSIGRQACEVIAQYPDRFELVGAVAGSDVDALASVMHRFGVPRGALVGPAAGASLPPGCASGMDAACEVAALDADVVCVAIAGAAALRPALAAIDRGRDIAVASKEILVMAGEIVRQRAARSGARLLPVDSEHSAIWQCLRGEDAASVQRIILTGSGGPFRVRALDSFATITRDEALRHPTWDMGPKITIDSATMMNKGLELIEAHYLFDVPFTRIDIVVHPSSTVHSMVEFTDGATLAQLGRPDMRLPIALALSGGVRLPRVHPAVDLISEARSLEFAALDDQRFPAPRVARRAGERGGTAPCVLNAANEAAVGRFLAGGCRFTDIVPLVEHGLATVPHLDTPSLDDLLVADAAARDAVVALRVPVAS